MAVIETAGSTPYYVLLASNRRIGPTVVSLPSGMRCTAIFAFSDKRPYEEFRAKSELELTPYPLVPGYLREEMSGPGDLLKLVVIDASGPREPHASAATMEAVLEAQVNRAACVNCKFRLTFDQEVDAFRVDGVVRSVPQSHTDHD